MRAMSSHLLTSQVGLSLLACDFKLCSIPCPRCTTSHRLKVFGMVVSPGSAHASWVDVVSHDVVVVGERYMAERALPGGRGPVRAVEDRMLRNRRKTNCNSEAYC